MDRIELTRRRNTARVQLVLGILTLVVAALWILVVMVRDQESVSGSGLALLTIVALVMLVRGWRGLSRLREQDETTKVDT